MTFSTKKVSSIHVISINKKKVDNLYNNSLEIKSKCFKNLKFSEKKEYQKNNKESVYELTREEYYQKFKHLLIIKNLSLQLEDKEFVMSYGLTTAGNSYKHDHIPHKPAYTRNLEGVVGKNGKSVKMQVTEGTCLSKETLLGNNKFAKALLIKTEEEYLQNCMNKEISLKKVVESVDVNTSSVVFLETGTVHNYKSLEDKESVKEWVKYSSKYLKPQNYKNNNDDEMI